MGDILTASTEALEAELARRKEATSTGPTPLPTPDWASLVNLITGGVAQSILDGYQDDDFDHFVYEAAMTAVYGEAYWEWRRKQGW